MEEYLECLYTWVSEGPRGQRLWTLAGYKEALLAREGSLSRLEALLSPAQDRALADYCAAELHLSFLEERALFQEALVLGQHLARG